jgi:ATP-dependent Clp protease protease subunit
MLSLLIWFNKENYMNFIKKLVAFSLLSVSAVSTAKTEVPKQPEVVVLKPGSFVRFTETVTDVSVSRFIKDFLSQSGDNITIYVDSPGGSVMDGLRAIEAVRAAKAANPNLRVTCVVGEAASMAFYFLQAACDDRFVSPTTILMHHQVSGGTQGQLRTMDARISFVKRLVDILDGQIAGRLGLTVKELQEKLAHDWWLVGEDAIKNKAADKIVLVTCSQELLSAPPNEDTKRPACPLIYSGMGGGSQNQQLTSPFTKQN